MDLRNVKQTTLALPITVKVKNRIVTGTELTMWRNKTQNGDMSKMRKRKSSDRNYFGRTNLQSLQEMRTRSVTKRIPAMFAGASPPAVEVCKMERDAFNAEYAAEDQRYLILLLCIEVVVRELSGTKSSHIMNGR
jgi:hypothetical protein